MSNLRFTNPPPAQRETLYSYLSRIATIWRTSIKDFAHDLGVPFKRLLDQDPEAVNEFIDWVGLTDGQRNELLSWTGIRVGEVRMAFRGEKFMSRALTNPVMRGCPICLRDDLAGWSGSAPAAMVMRGDWQMREASVCVRHGHPLVSLWEARNPRERFDIAARLVEIEDAILSGAFDQPRLTPSAYDHWLDRRLAGYTDTTWFAHHSLYAITTICGLLGQAILKGEPHVDCNHPGIFHAKGFAAAVESPTALRQSLDAIASNTTDPLAEPQKAFGLLYSRMNESYLNEKVFDTFRFILRDCILDNWPIASGETLLGLPVAERRLHSLRSAALETGVGAKVLEHFLVEAGALSADDQRPANRRLIDARKHAALLAEIPTLVGPIAMRNAMGATLRELAALEESGLLVPRTRVSKVKNPWRISDGLALVAELQSAACSVHADDNDWESLLLAYRRSNKSLFGLVQGIRDGILAKGQREGIEGFHGIVVRKSDVDTLDIPEDETMPSAEVSLPGITSAAAFGRSVGLRDHGSFIALVDAGETPALRFTHPKTKRPQYRMMQSDIEMFHRRFVTLTTLALETGLHRNSLSARLENAGVLRFSPNGQDFGAVFLRSEAEIALQ